MDHRDYTRRRAGRSSERRIGVLLLIASLVTGCAYIAGFAHFGTAAGLVSLLTLAAGTALLTKDDQRCRERHPFAATQRQTAREKQGLLHRPHLIATR